MSEPSSEDDYSVSSEDVDDEKYNPGNAPIMSLFASYYGIENPAAPSPPQTHSDQDSIDEVNFNADKYVRHLLLNEPIEGLVTKDAELAHEIRTLDGEMQKLVYDNYNKFITATETIKEMKNDVFAMDQDMEAVRQRMVKITHGSMALDEVLDEKRAKVNKLVRVRRLLDRLAFLSELPQRLEELIDRERFKEAVQLYNKTISVLTRHSHVLSFKNIKERTELMMSNLTEKVMKSMDEPLLEAVKVTQFVSVLHLMKAPRLKVVSKLLAAHQRRALRLVEDFRATLSLSAADGVGAATVCVSANADEQQKRERQRGASAREFSQSVLVCLLEACDGVDLLFKPITNSNSNSNTQREEHSGTEEEEQRTAFVALQTMLCAVMREFSQTFCAAFSSFFSSFEASLAAQPAQFLSQLESEHAETVEVLRSQIARVCSSSSSSVPLAVSLCAPSSSSSVAAVRSREEEENNDNEEESGGEDSVCDSERAAAPQFTPQDARAAWLLLAKQSVLEIAGIDHALAKISHRHHTQAALSLAHTEHGTVFGDALLQVVSAHNARMQRSLVSFFAQQLRTYWLPRIALLTHGREKLLSARAERESGATTGRAVLQSLSSLTRTVHSGIVTQCLNTFAECVRTHRPVLEMYAVMNRQRDAQHALCADLVSSFTQDLLQEMTSLCAVLVDTSVESPSRTHRRDRESEDSEETTLDIVERESVERSEVKDEAQLCTASLFSHLFVEDTLLIVCSSLLREFASPSLLDKMDVTLSDNGFVSLRQSEQRQSCTETLLRTSRLLANCFLERNATVAAERAVDIHSSIYLRSLSASLSDSTAMKISADTLDLVVFLDQLVQVCCLSLGDALPVSREREKERDNMRRSSVTRAPATALQRDIERLFSVRVRVFESLPVDFNAEFILVTVLKAAVKASQETIRTMSFPSAGYLEIQAVAALLRHVCASLAQDTHAVDALLDALLSTNFSRYLGANDFASATDNAELASVHRAVAEALQSLPEEALLTAKTVSSRHS